MKRSKRLTAALASIVILPLFPLSVSADNGLQILKVQYKKPQGAKIAPKEKQMCIYEKKLYEMGTRLEIGGKIYICSLSESPNEKHRPRWVLSPVQ